MPQLALDHVRDDHVIKARPQLLELSLASSPVRHSTPILHSPCLASVLTSSPSLERGASGLLSMESLSAGAWLSDVSVNRR